MRSLFLFLLALTLSILSINAQSLKDQSETLDQFIIDGIKKWNPPGLAVTVVKDGAIVFKKAYGVTNINTQQAVDTNTLFGCMSTTKAFVSAGLAMLVDDGKLNWDDKVIDYLPEFQLKDPYITREITIKDLLTHRTGIGNTDYLWGIMTIDSDSVLYKMREVDKAYSLRSSFMYQNIFYLAAGKVIEKVSGKSWGEFLKEHIYMPLGMTNTYPTLEAIKAIKNKADAHFEIDGKIEKIDQVNADAIGPAGAMWSSIDDIGKWIQFLLNNGIKNNDTLISPKNFRELFKPQQIIPSNEFYPTQQVTKPNWMTYGLGWFQHDYKGKMVQFHTGSLAGMVAIAGMIPEDHVGVFVMGNLDHVELRHAIMYAVFDLYTEGKVSRNWSEDFYNLYHPEKKEEPEMQPISDTTPTFDEKDMMRKYTNSQFGWLKVYLEEGAIKFNMNNTIFGKLSHWNYDTFQGTFDKMYWCKTMFKFRLGSDGQLSHVDVFGEQYYLIKEN
jgi:CubicO group peptidase (beta-lactamase class C family)